MRLIVAPSYLLPVTIVFGICLAIACIHAGQPQLAQTVLVITVVTGSLDLCKQTISSLLHKRFALDYIALTAIIAGLLAHQLFVAAVICLMLAGGNELENYAKRRARASLKALVSRIPESVYLWVNQSIGSKILVTELQVGQQIIVRRGEVVPTDGQLVSAEALIDEASLTGESVPVQKTTGDLLLSGTTNTSNQLILTVTKTGNESTYHKIITLIEEAQSHKSPLIRLADRYSGFFTLCTFLLAGGAWLATGSIDRALAVLVLATPCPLILATPIALLGGMNALAKRGVIVKNLASIELLGKTTDIVFDKTGTLTLGELNVTTVTALTKNYTQEQILSIAAAIERSSLHPIAKAIVQQAHTQQLTLPTTTDTTETIGKGISATVNGAHYSLNNTSAEHLIITLFEKNLAIGEITLTDTPKPQSAAVLRQLASLGLQLHVLSGDLPARVSELVKELSVSVRSKAQCTPQSKTDYVAQLQKQGSVVTMIGDGINDAPAVATADVGVVFSHDEASASSNAADVVLITNQFSAVWQLIAISKSTITIALQSIWVGLGLSIIGMVLASFGLIPPIVGALSQEVIDVLVILNAIRASRT